MTGVGDPAVTAFCSNPGPGGDGDAPSTWNPSTCLTGGIWPPVIVFSCPPPGRAKGVDRAALDVHSRCLKDGVKINNRNSLVTKLGRVVTDPDRSTMHAECQNAEYATEALQTVYSSGANISYTV